MKISLINASPKMGDSNTGFLLDALARHIAAGHALHRHNLGRGKGFPAEILREIAADDAIVLGFPLYVDALPSSLTALLIALEDCLKTESRHDRTVYAIINNGFYEGRQTCIAFEIVQNWCERAGVKFGGGIGQGADETIGILQKKKVPWRVWPFGRTERALIALARTMEEGAPFGIRYLTPAFPKFLFCFLATHFFWHPLAKKNGLHIKTLPKKENILMRTMHDPENL
ncbi:MAG: NAD(P)H-dependent oxidoreductase [Burkholderiaceae bacterium]|jgi:multimeric flavodoxin WrbA|nr:NAD(P)H-dependent oxidoreductase [Burkholderiaceae bacterium]